MKPVHRRYLILHHQLTTRQIELLATAIETVTECSQATMDVFKERLHWLGLPENQAKFFIAFVFDFRYRDENDEDSSSDSELSDEE